MGISCIFTCIADTEIFLKFFQVLLPLLWSDYTKQVFLEAMTLIFQSFIFKSLNRLFATFTADSSKLLLFQAFIIL